MTHHRTSLSSSEASANFVHFNLNGTCLNYSSSVSIGPSNSHLSSHWSGLLVPPGGTSYKGGGEVFLVIGD